MRTLGCRGVGGRARIVLGASILWVFAAVAGVAADGKSAPETVVRKRKEPARLQLTGGEAELKSAADVPPAEAEVPRNAAKPAADAPQPLPPPPATAAPTPPSPPTPARPAAVNPDGTATLRYRFAVNQQTYYTVNHKMTITTQKDQTSETAQNESDTVRHFRVVSVEPNGNALLELMIDRVKMTARFGENDPIEFDSTRSDSPAPQFRNVKEAIGKPTARIKVSPRGELLDVVRLNGTAAPGNDAADSDPANNFLAILPEQPVRVGESWTDRIDVRVSVSKELTRNVTILRKYELTAIKGNEATIAVASTVITPIRDPQLNAQLIQRTPAGSIVFDMDKGQIVSREMKSDKTEIGAFGDNSSMRAVSARLEKLTTRDAALQTATSREPNLK